MDEAQRVQEGERAQHLARDALDARVAEVRLVARLAVVLLELVQVGAQQLAHQEEVLLQVRRAGPSQAEHGRMRRHVCRTGWLHAERHRRQAHGMAWHRAGGSRSLEGQAGAGLTL